MTDSVDIEDWVRDQPNAQIPEAKSYHLRLWNGDGFDEKRSLNDAEPTGRQILEAFHRFPADEYVLLYLPHNGKLEEIDIDETLDLRAHGPERFFAFKTDRLLNFVANGRRFSWGAPKISVPLVRLIARIPEEETLFLERTNAPDEELADSDTIRLSGTDLERLVSRQSSWKLKVQGKLIVSKSPTISVVDALAQAGFDPNAWIIILNVRGKPKRQLSVGDSVDLTTPGIEKIRLTAKDVNNGEAPVVPRREFALQSVDETYLNGLDLRWETDEEGRWLLIHDYPIPQGYNATTVTLALQIMPGYPQTQIDMFYVYPELQRSAGGTIPATQSKKTIRGQVFQRWSRHRGPGSAWNPRHDNVVTHLALVEGALAKEVGA